jgi:hypothetical protein
VSTGTTRTIGFFLRRLFEAQGEKSVRPPPEKVRAHILYVFYDIQLLTLGTGDNLGTTGGT